MIRLAVDDSETLEKTDTTFLTEQITTRAGPYPPNENLQSIGERLKQPNFLCLIDSDNGTVAGFLVLPVAQEVTVIWWLPRARWAEDNMRQLVPVFGATCEEVLRRWPQAEGWPIYGDYPGVGETWSARRRSSFEMVGVWMDYFNSAPGLHNPPDDGFAERLLNPHNAGQFRLKGTVGKVVQFATWVAVSAIGP